MWLGMGYMSFLDIIERAKAYLERHHRMSLRRACGTIGLPDRVGLAWLTRLAATLRSALLQRPTPHPLTVHGTLERESGRRFVDVRFYGATRYRKGYRKGGDPPFRSFRKWGVPPLRPFSSIMFICVHPWRFEA